MTLGSEPTSSAELDNAPLPPVYEILLDLAALRDVLLDLELGTKIQAIRAKSHPTLQSSAAPQDLTHLASELWDSPGHAAQVSYTYQGKLWVDTFLRGDHGVKLVRIATGDVPA
jgi:hypothetical protein